MDYQRHRPNYEKCVICGQRKPLEAYTCGGLCDRKCEDCVGKDYVPEFAREKSLTASPAATFAISIAVTAATSFAVGFYVASAIASNQVLEALSR